MIQKKHRSLYGWLLVSIPCLWLASVISSCGKTNITSAAGLNIRYEVLNLSPDLTAVNLYIHLLKVNSTPFSFTVNQGYFSVTALDTPYLFRSALVTGGPILLSRSDTLKRNLSYSLFITGSLKDNTLKPIFTIDTAAVPAIGRGKVRFVDASPSGASGLDVYANGTKIFNKVVYPNYSGFLEIPNGNYDLQIKKTGSAAVLKTLQSIKIADGRLYTIYAYGYTNRIDSASFNADIITNR
ncbi:MAG: DUF4397 domain-containing protein [Mucilaginibacter sp.]